MTTLHTFVDKWFEQTEKNFLQLESQHENLLKNCYDLTPNEGISGTLFSSLEHAHLDVIQKVYQNFRDANEFQKQSLAAIDNYSPF